MRTLLNIIWIVFAGFWLFLGYVLAGVLLCIPIITIPWAIASFRTAGYVIWPFGRMIVPKPTAGVASFLGNVIWVIFAGWWLGARPPGERHRAVHHDHRHPDGDRGLQDDPDLAHAARQGHRLDPHRRLRLNPGTNGPRHTATHTETIVHTPGPRRPAGLAWGHRGDPGGPGLRLITGCVAGSTPAVASTSAPPHAGLRGDGRFRGDGGFRGDVRGIRSSESCTLLGILRPRPGILLVWLVPLGVVTLAYRAWVRRLRRPRRGIPLPPSPPRSTME